MKNPSCFWHHLIFNPHPPFSRPAAGSGFFDSKTSKLLRCWTRYYAGARSQYLARARGAHRAGRSGRGGQGGGLLLAAVQGIGAGDQARRRGAVAASSGGLRPHRGGAEVFPGRTDPQRGGIIQHSEGGAASLAGRCWRSRKKKKTAGRAVWPALPVLLSAAVLSSQRRRGHPVWATLAAICSTAPRFTECRRGAFHGVAGRYFSPCREGGYTLHLTGLRSRCRALT